MDKIVIEPTLGEICAVMSPPGSKSLTNRALLLAAIAQGDSTLEGILESDDTLIMLNALRLLGVEIDHDRENHRMNVKGCGGLFPRRDAEFNVGNSGTTARFLTAAIALAPELLNSQNEIIEKKYRVFGKPRMHQRPIHDLSKTLRQLGANIKSENSDGCPPILVGSSEYAQNDWNTSGSQGRPIVASVSGTISSQFLSAVMMSAPLISQRNDIVLRIVGRLVSFPYVKMTANIMRSFGVETHFFSLNFWNSGDENPDAFQKNNGGTITIPQGSVYRGRKYRIEPDASAASYFFAAVAVCGGKITIPGLSTDSLQGDVAFVDCLEKMGCSVRRDSESMTVERKKSEPLHGITVDMNAISDTVQTLGVVALFAEGPTQITNVAHIRHKETDRIRAVATELRKIGAEVEEFDDGLQITPPKERKFAEITTYDDHRMAMSFAIAGLQPPGIAILDPNCVDKTYPAFFQDLQKILNI